MKQVLVLVIFSLCVLYFSYRLLDVPRGITIDEAAFGYNASLISQTSRDENGRFLPVFVLSLQGRDWRQPVAQYLQVGMFKVFGRSLFNLKLISVLTAAFSALLLLYLGNIVMGKKYGVLALIIFLTTPVVMIHSHLALDNITPVPFILLWLIGLWNFNKYKNLKYLILSGVSLGISFYAHKSMRSAAPVWTVLTLFYLFFTQVKSWKRLPQNYKPIIFFLAGIAPFYLVSPILDYKYAGAVYGSQAIGVNSIYNFFNFYLSNFDPSFLFITGDTILHHSTGVHGMFLLAALPLFLCGVYHSFKQKNIFFTFLVICFFTGPLLLGFIGSIHRASRIIFLVPFFSLISTYGGLKLWQSKNLIFKTGLLLLSLVYVLNSFDFLNYYWFKYPQDTYHIFYSPEGLGAYQKLDQVSKKENLLPLVAEQLLNTQGDGGSIEDFSRSLFFANPTPFTQGLELPPESILLTRDKNFKSGELIDSGVKGYFLYKRLE